jgi:Fe-S cluster assembly protein SufD
METTRIANSQTEFRTIDKREPEWLYNTRQNGWSFYDSQPLPDRVVHLWRYTDPREFRIAELHELVAARPPHAGGTRDDATGLKPDSSGYAYNRSDLTTSIMLAPELAEQGVVLIDLFAGIRSHEGLIREHLGHLIGDEFGKFEALNLALWNTGLFLYVPDNVQVEMPVRLRRHPAGPATFHRLLAVIGKNAKVTVVDDYLGGRSGDSPLVNSAVEIYAADASQVTYANLLRHSDGVKTYITQRTRVGRDAEALSIFAGLGGGLSKVNAGSIMSGRGAHSQLYGMAFGDKEQSFDYHTLHHHLSSRSYSNIDFKAALRGRAHSAYTGLIRIEEDALDCEAYQENRNLLLDSDTKAESIPELEILCDQVQCTHGSATGPIDPETLFYLKSRGLSDDEATRTIVSGFMEPTVSRLPSDLREMVREIVMAKLESGGNG